MRGGDDVELTDPRRPRHGPLLSDVSTDLSTVGANAEAPEGRTAATGYAVALRVDRARARRRPPTRSSALNRATDWDEFRAAAADFAVPAQNLVYADREGHIGYQAPGRIPIRKSGNDGYAARRPAGCPRTTGPATYVPFDGAAERARPGRGLRGHRQPGGGRTPTYPYYLTDDWDYGYRSQRIRDLLEDGAATSRSRRWPTLQLDDRNPLAPVLVPYLLDVRLPARLLQRRPGAAAATGTSTRPPTRAAAAYFNAVWRNLLAADLPRRDCASRCGPTAGSAGSRSCRRLLRQPGERLVGRRQHRRASRPATTSCAGALLDARDELTRLQARDPDEWTWGRPAPARPARARPWGSPAIGLVEWLFNRDGWEVGGGGAIVNATGVGRRRGATTSPRAPSMRMVVSLADLDDSRWINLTGVSGHAVPRPLHRPDRPVGRRRDPALAVLARRRRGRREETLTLVP